MLELGEIHKHTNITELWSNNTVNGSLQQVLYYFEAGLVSKGLALRICDDIHQVINHVEKQTIKQCIGGQHNNNTFMLYKCDLHMLTNTIMVITLLIKCFLHHLRF